MKEGPGASERSEQKKKKKKKFGLAAYSSVENLEHL